jgi:hypothetical protein
VVGGELGAGFGGIVRFEGWLGLFYLARFEMLFIMADLYSVDMCQAGGMVRSNK